MRGRSQALFDRELDNTINRLDSCSITALSTDEYGVKNKKKNNSMYHASNYVVELIILVNLSNMLRMYIYCTRIPIKNCLQRKKNNFLYL